MLENTEYSISIRGKSQNYARNTVLFSTEKKKSGSKKVNGRFKCQKKRRKVSEKINFWTRNKRKWGRKRPFHRLLPFSPKNMTTVNTHVK